MHVAERQYLPGSTGDGRIRRGCLGQVCNKLDILWLDKNRMVTMVRSLRAVVKNEQLKPTVIINALDAKNVTDATTKKVSRLSGHITIDVRWNLTYSNRITNFDAGLCHAPDAT